MPLEAASTVGAALSLLSPASRAVLEALLILPETGFSEVAVRAVVGLHEATPATLEGLATSVAGPELGTPEVNGAARQTLLAQLRALVQQGLLQESGGRYSLPISTRAGLGELSLERRQALEHSFVQGMLEWLGRNSGQLQALQSEESAWLLAISLARAASWWDELGHLVGQVCSPGGYYHRRRDLKARAHLLNDAATALTGRGDSLEAWILYLHAGVLREQNQLEAALRCLERSEALSQSLGETRALGMAQGEQAAIRMVQTQFQEAISLYYAKLDAMQKVADPREFQATLGELVEALTVAGKLEEALGLQEQRIGLLQTMQEDRAAALAGLGMGDLLVEMNRYADALSLYQEAIEVLRELDPRNCAVALANMAIYQSKMNDLPAARATLLEAVHSFQALGLRSQAAQAQAFLEELGG